ncbi:hypothetical protein DPMN_049189 [Dreissena polymorpha]|uniref:Uncharacterized protein n=1 Tax=Dreissena polymorpha TaxID=45954 RepID=A0A9D4DDR7_DREPO|nr:hypothetical protein DPMN_049189 [Dreissena polymorpha]
MCLRDQRISRPAFAIGPVPTRPAYLQTSLRNWSCANATSVSPDQPSQLRSLVRSYAVR